MNICVYCASSETIDRTYLDAGESFGEQLARRNHTLIFGAGKFGIMGAVARGLRREGGSAVGIIPRFFDDVDVMFKDCEIVYTDTMRERKQIMEDRSDGFVIMPGGIGTFEEFFEVLTLKQLGRHKKPIAVYNVNGYYNGLSAMLESAVVQGFMSEKCRRLCFVSEDAREILRYIENGDEFSYNKYDFLEK